MSRYCLSLAAGTLLGVLIVGVVGVTLIEFTSALESEFHR